MELGGLGSKNPSDLKPLVHDLPPGGVWSFLVNSSEYSCVFSALGLEVLALAGGGRLNQKSSCPYGGTWVLGSQRSLFRHLAKAKQNRKHIGKQASMVAQETLGPTDSLILYQVRV